MTHTIDKRTIAKNSARWKVFERDGWRCVVCGSTENLTFDHVIPKCQGGKTSVQNGQTLCVRHNTMKAHLPNDLFWWAISLGVEPRVPKGISMRKRRHDRDKGWSHGWSLGAREVIVADVLKRFNQQMTGAH